LKLMESINKKEKWKRSTSAEDLAKLIHELDADRSEKIRRLNETLIKLNRARTVVRNQKEILKRLRARIVELTPVGVN